MTQSTQPNRMFVAWIGGIHGPTVNEQRAIDHIEGCFGLHHKKHGTTRIYSFTVLEGEPNNLLRIKTAIDREMLRYKIPHRFEMSNEDITMTTEEIDHA